MRTVTLAFALAYVVALIGFTVFELGATPLNSGPLGMLASALFVMGVVALVRVPRDAVAGFGAAMALMLAHARREEDLRLAAWTAAGLLIVGLAAGIAKRERRADHRAAIHARIDEELVDSTRLA